MTNISSSRFSLRKFVLIVLSNYMPYVYICCDIRCYFQVKQNHILFVFTPMYLWDVHVLFLLFAHIGVPTPFSYQTIFLLFNSYTHNWCHYFSRMCIYRRLSFIVTLTTPNYYHIDLLAENQNYVFYFHRSIAYLNAEKNVIYLNCLSLLNVIVLRTP